MRETESYVKRNPDLLQGHYYWASILVRKIQILMTTVFKRVKWGSEGQKSKYSNCFRYPLNPKLSLKWHPSGIILVENDYSVLILNTKYKMLSFSHSESFMGHFTFFTQLFTYSIHMAVFTASVFLKMSLVTYLSHTQKNIDKFSG